MKFLDKVQVINDCNKYSKEEVFKGMIGTIIDAEIRDNCFNVIFIDERVKNKEFMKNEKNFLSLKDDIICPIKIKDLSLVEDKCCSDEKILESIPLQNKKWWCKVEDGYIINLNGDRKNGKYLDTSYLYKMLFNSKYNGRVVHNDTTYTNIYPQLIDNETWQKVQEYHKTNKHSPSRKKEIYDFLLSGKLICGDCKRLMVGDSGTSSTGEKYYYYSCLSKRRKNIDCKQKPVKKQELEDLVINSTSEMLKQDENIQRISHILFDLYEKKKKENLELNNLIRLKDEKIKASKNIIDAIEKGLYSEMTKTRLAELENEIEELEIKISKEKRKTYYDLTLQNIQDYLKSKVFENTDNIEVRKLIVNTFIREILLYQDKMYITFNFCEPLEKQPLNKENILKIEKQIDSAFSINESSFIYFNSPANENQMNTIFSDV